MISTNALGQDVCKYLLFAHAILGCDTTSSVYGIGKGQSLTKLMLPYFIQQAQIFLHPHAPKNRIIEATVGDNSDVDDDDENNCI
jgi:hypothetical protein